MWQVRLPIPYYFITQGHQYSKVHYFYYVVVPALYLCQSQMPLSSVFYVSIYIENFNYSSQQRRIAVLLPLWRLSLHVIWRKLNWQSRYVAYVMRPQALYYYDALIHSLKRWWDYWFGQKWFQ
jgi:hypothetical protein